MKLQTDQIEVFFNPHSVAVVGASRNVNKAGHVIFKNFAENRARGIFKGSLYAINPNETEVLSYRCYPSLSRVIDPIEVVVVVVPSQFVPQVMREAAAKKVKAAVIISSGFREVGNIALEEEIKGIAQSANMRLLGPNCLGVYDSRTGVDMIFLPETKILQNGNEVVVTPRPMPGNLAIVTQSGAFGVAALDYLAGREMGVSKFVSFGNKADVNEPELLAYLMEDRETEVILLYAEGIAAGRKFLEIAKEVTKTKPIIALKTGKTSSGARAAVSHTGALSGTDKIYDGAFAQAGVIRARDMDDFFHIAKAFSTQPPPEGDGIAVLTDAGGPGVMAADECDTRGISIRKLSDVTLQKFEVLKDQQKIPKFAATLNPVDLTGSASSEMFELATKILLDDPDVHSLIVIGLHHVPGLDEDFVDRIANVTSQYRKPVVACDIGETEMAMYVRSRFEKMGIPSYSSPEDAARSLVALVRYGLYLKKEGCYDAYLANMTRKKTRGPK
ncbi:CoA-binding protein [Candidatus Bathyarchaeota archaeon]|nr:CoA-binding protein [Candidatus Bathyarchaeota archaeon]